MKYLEERELIDFLIREIPKDLLAARPAGFIDYCRIVGKLWLMLDWVRELPERYEDVEIHHRLFVLSRNLNLKPPIKDILLTILLGPKYRDIPFLVQRLLNLPEEYALKLVQGHGFDELLSYVEREGLREKELAYPFLLTLYNYVSNKRNLGLLKERGIRITLDRSVERFLGDGFKKLLVYLERPANLLRLKETVSRWLELDYSELLRRNRLSYALNAFVKHILRLEREANFESLYEKSVELLLNLRFILALSLLIGSEDKLDVFKTVLSKRFISRVAYTAVEEHVNKELPGAPFIVCQEPYNPRSVFGEGINFIVVYDTLKNFFRGVIWDASLDAAELYYSERDKINVIGVYWKDLEKAGNTLNVRRGMFVHPREGLMVEADFTPPLEPDYFIILSLRLYRERELHEKISSYILSSGYPLANPYFSARRADDKMLTHFYLESYNAEIEMPRYLFFRKNTSRSCIERELKAFLRDLYTKRIVVKPNHGTEGLRVKCFSVISEGEFNRAVDYVLHLLRGDEVLVEEYRGNVTYRGLALTLRVVVSWNGESFKVEGGFAQVASPSSHITSLTHGGKVININHALSHLTLSKSAGTKTERPIEESELKTLLDTCKRVGYAINQNLKEEEYLKYMGIDLVLELKGESLKPVVLEVNSRPSGLTYLRRISPGLEGEANVMKNLFKGVVKFSRARM